MIDECGFVDLECNRARLYASLYNVFNDRFRKNLLLDRIAGNIDKEIGAVFFLQLL